MPIKTEKVLCNFVGDFIVFRGNLVSNADALCKLNDHNEDGVFNKLMVVQAGAIVEAALAEIIYRAKNFNREGVPNIPEADRLKIEEEKTDTFFQVIEVLQDYKVLDELGADIYDELHKLRNYRNKVHIQKKFKDVPDDEADAFTDELCEWALALNVRVLKHLNAKFSRPKGLDQFAREVSFPSP